MGGCGYPAGSLRNFAWAGATQKAVPFPRSCKRVVLNALPGLEELRVLVTGGALAETWAHLLACDLAAHPGLKLIEFNSGGMSHLVRKVESNCRRWNDIELYDGSKSIVIQARSEQPG